MKRAFYISYKSILIFMYLIIVLIESMHFYIIMPAIF